MTLGRLPDEYVKCVECGFESREIKYFVGRKCLWCHQDLPFAHVLAVGSDAGPGHIAFLDYDGVDDQVVDDDLWHVQKALSLGDIHIFKSSTSSYHAICFDIVDMKTILKIPIISSRVDRYHIRAGGERGHLTLRLTPKRTGETIHRVGCMANEDFHPTNPVLWSKAHFELYQSMFPGMWAPSYPVVWPKDESLRLEGYIARAKK